MRTSAVFTVAVFAVFFFCFGAILVAQPGGQPRQVVEWQSDGSQRTVVVPVQQGGGQQPPWVQGTQTVAPGGRGGQPAAATMQGNQPARPGQPVAAQGNPQARPAQPVTQGQPGTLNPNQVTQMIARLRAMDTNQNGVLEANEIPANQRDRVSAMVTQLGGNPNSNAINLANLERRAMATAGVAGNVQPNQQQGADNAGRQPRQQPVEPPLVRPFGEQVAANTLPLGFGQRDRIAQTTPQQATRGGRQGGAAPGGSTQSVTVRQSTPYDNIPAALRTGTFSWFFEYDTDQDGQLTMLEYVNGRGGGWTEQIANEFKSLDRNGDGFVTMEEALTTIKEWDERRAQEAGAVTPQATTPATRQQGPPGAIPTTTAPTNANRGQQAGNAAANQGRPAANNQGNVQQGRPQGGQQMGPGGRGSGNNQPNVRGGGPGGGRGGG